MFITFPQLWKWIFSTINKIIELMYRKCPVPYPKYLDTFCTPKTLFMNIVTNLQWIGWKSKLQRMLSHKGVTILGTTWSLISPITLTYRIDSAQWIHSLSSLPWFGYMSFYW
jgi:hypothetical protein